MANTNKKVQQSEKSTTKPNPKVAKFNYNQAIKSLHTKSAVIRSLASEGLSTNEITHLLQEQGVTNGAGDTPIRYQHVRNVLKMPVGKPSEAEDSDNDNNKS